MNLNFLRRNPTIRSMLRFVKYRVLGMKMPAAPQQAAPVPAPDPAPPVDEVAASLHWIAGFYQDNPNWLWMSRNAQLSLDAKCLPVTFSFQLRANPADFYKTFPFRLNIFAGDQRIREVIFTDSSRVQNISLNLEKSEGDVFLRFESESFFCPAERGESTDSRELAVIFNHPLFSRQVTEEMQSQARELPEIHLDKNTADFHDLAQLASEYRSALTEIKEQAAPASFWYPYNILANLTNHLDVLLKGDNRRLLGLVQGRPVADIGAADGDLSFFLEYLGVKDIDLIDHGLTNYNGLQGAEKLKQVFSSNVRIHDIDLNNFFELPRQDYGLIFFLGTLYHLENPFYTLKKLAQSTEYCLISTRVARYAMNKTINFQAAPMAYLVDTHETNNDSTNYWVFSEGGLRRILKRTGWKVLDFMTVGAVESDPANPQADERAFCLVQSNLH